jgi:hypothetical protein
LGENDSNERNNNGRDGHGTREWSSVQALGSLFGELLKIQIYLTI